MSLSYHYSFSAPKTVAASELEHFLKNVELAAKKIGFQPTTVINAVFHTAEEKQFARQLTTGLFIEDPRLVGVTLIDESKIWSYNRVNGSCRVIPEKGELLVVTDERGCETVFGFLWYPDRLTDINGKVLTVLPSNGHWCYRSFVNSPDPRYREIVSMFAKAGYMESEHDEFAIHRGKPQ